MQFLIRVKCLTIENWNSIQSNLARLTRKGDIYNMGYKYIKVEKNEIKVLVNVPNPLIYNTIVMVKFRISTHTQLYIWERD